MMASGKVVKQENNKRKHKEHQPCRDITALDISA